MFLARVQAVLLAGTIDAVLPMLELSASGDEGCLEAAVTLVSACPMLRRRPPPRRALAPGTGACMTARLPFVGIAMPQLSAASTAVGICAPSLPLHTVGQQLQVRPRPADRLRAPPCALAAGRGDAPA